MLNRVPIQSGRCTVIDTPLRMSAVQHSHHKAAFLQSAPLTAIPEDAGFRDGSLRQWWSFQPLVGNLKPALGLAANPFGIGSGG